MVARGSNHKGLPMRIVAPNYTQAPNELFDEWLPLLGHAELKVLLVVMRKTFGWHKVYDRISLTQLERMTGLQRKHIIKAVKSLEARNLIRKYVLGERGSQQTFYELVIEDSNNSYQCPSDTTPQCPKDTPPSVLKTPTKETLTKETNTKEREREAAPPAPSFSFHRNGRVKIEKTKIDKLYQEFGEKRILEMMDRLDEYADINPKRFKQYACHAAVIRKWIRDDKEKNSSLNASKINSDEHENTKIAQGWERIILTRNQGGYVDAHGDGLYLVKDGIEFVGRDKKQGTQHITTRIPFKISHQEFMERCKPFLKYFLIV